MNKKYFFLITLLPIALSSPFYQGNGDDKISSFEQNISGVNFNRDSNHDVTMNGDGFATLTVNSNNSDGYTVYMKAAKGTLESEDGEQSIRYTITCNDFLTEPGGMVVPGVKNIRLKPHNSATKLFLVTSPPNPTVNAKITCNLVPDKGQKLNSLLSGKYTDDITFYAHSKFPGEK